MKTISLAMLLIGTMVGAGFATGREILGFFGANIPLYVAPLCGVLIFGGSVLFLSVGKKAGGTGISEVNHKILGKFHIGADIFLLFNSLVVLSGMLAAMDSLFSMLLPIAPAYSVISGILCALIVAKGIKGLLRGNLIVVPMVVLSIITVCSFAMDSAVFSFSFKFFTLPAALIYVSMNMMLACSVFAGIKNLTHKQIIFASALASVIITALLMLIITVLNGMSAHGAMPLLEMAQKQSKVLFYISVASVAVSIFSTMMVAMSGLNTWLKDLIGDKKYSVAIVLLAGLILSNVGFENVVGFLYPVIGGVGLIYTALCIAFLLLKSRSKNNGVNKSKTLLSDKIQVKQIKQAKLINTHTR